MLIGGCLSSFSFFLTKSRDPVPVPTTGLVLSHPRPLSSALDTVVMAYNPFGNSKRERERERERQRERDQGGRGGRHASESGGSGSREGWRGGHAGRGGGVGNTDRGTGYGGVCNLTIEYTTIYISIRLLRCPLSFRSLRNSALTQAVFCDNKHTIAHCML